MGDKEKAREEVDTALSIDPEFLAARLLRDQLNAPDTPVVPASVSVPPPPAAPSPSLASSAATLAQFEERIKQRVREREAAPPPAAAPVRRRGATTVRTGAVVAAAGVAFAVAMSSNSRVREPQLLTSRAMTFTASLVDVVNPDPLDLPAPVVTVTDDEEPRVFERPFMRPVPPAPARVMLTAPLTTTPTPAPAPTIATPLPVQAVPVNAVVTDSPPPALIPRAVNERALVEETLNKYRWAYNRLDAQSAQAVYPAVNANALARAFDALQSQSLQFDECEIDVRGGVASATCRGSSRYVPKIGNRDPHIEPRVWDFTLKKDGTDWQIESARAQR